MEWLRRQTPAARVLLEIFAGALCAAGIVFGAGYFGFTVLRVIGTLVVGVCVFIGWWAISFLPNRSEPR